MPHKHKRRQKDESSYDLPPTVIAKPLPVHKSKQQKPSTKKATTQNAAAQSKGASKWADDTPRAFARLMRFQQTGQTPSGLDDGNDKKSKGKKRKRDETQNGAGSSLPAKSTSKVPETVTPKILPGEKLSDFAARVDQAMPLSAMKKSHRTGASETLPKIREDRITKHEKHLRKLQQGWREEEARLRAKEAEERELREAENDELEDTWREALAEAGIDTTKQKKKKKGQSKKRKKGAKGGIEEDDIGNGTDDDDDDDDPWAKLNTRERAAKLLNPLEVVQAPPESLAKPREIFRVRRGLGGAEVDVANIPATAGSLRRREELAEERKSIVEEYRRLMAAKRGQ